MRDWRSVSILPIMPERAAGASLSPAPAAGMPASSSTDASSLPLTLPASLPALPALRSSAE